jgi:CBS domain-containing protein
MTLHGNDEVRLAMHSPVVAVHPVTTLRTAAKVLHGHDIGAVAVMEGGELVGMLSERDLVRALSDGVDPDRTPVASTMDSRPRAVDAHSPLSTATLVMLHTGVRHLPVTDHDQSDRPVGMLSIRDALAVMERDRIIEPAARMQTVHEPLAPAGPEPGR